MDRGAWWVTVHIVAKSWTEEVLRGDFVAVRLGGGAELDADLRRHELLDADVALAKERAVLAGQAQLDGPDAAGLLGGNGKRRAEDGAGGVGARLFNVGAVGSVPGWGTKIPPYATGHLNPGATTTEPT